MISFYRGGAIRLVAADPRDQISAFPPFLRFNAATNSQYLFLLVLR